MSNSRVSFDSGRTGYGEPSNNQGFGSPARAPEGGAVAITMANSMIGAQKIAIPRRQSIVMAKIQEMAAMNGSDFKYQWEVKNNATGKKDLVEGPTIKCAQIVAMAYGNCSVDTRVEYSEAEGGWWIYARFSDYESGYQMTRPFFQTRRNMMKMKDEQRATEMIIAIGVSKAIRNVIVNALPAYIGYALEEADRKVLDFVTAEPDRAKAYINKICNQYNLSLTQAAKFFGRPLDKMLPADLARMVMQCKGVEDGSIDHETLWADNVTVEPEPAAPAAQQAAQQVVGEPAAPAQAAKPAAAPASDAPPAPPAEAAAAPKPPAKKKATASAPPPPPPPPAEEPAGNEEPEQQVVAAQPGLTFGE